MKATEIVSLVVLTLVLCLSIASIAVISLVYVNQGKTSTARPPRPTAPPGTVSKSPGFKDAADLLLTGLDRRFDPCDDFYRFTCQKYLDNAVLPPGRSSIGTASDTQRKINKFIAEKLTTVSDQSSKTERIMKKAYDECMDNAKKGTTDRSKQVNELIQELFSGFPVLTPQWRAPNNTGLWKSIANLELRYATSTLLSSYVGTDPLNLKKNAFYVDQISLYLPRNMYISPQYIQTLDNYRNYVIQLVKLFKNNINSNAEDEDIEKQLTETVKFEVELAMATLPRDALRNSKQQYNPFKLGELKDSFAQIDWDAYLSTMLSNATKDYQSRNYIIEMPSYLSALNTILAENSKRFSKKTIVNFLVLRLLQNNDEFLAAGNSMYKPIFVELNAIRNKPKVFGQEEDSSFCIGTLHGIMPYGTGYVYLKNTPKEQRDSVAADIKLQTNLVIDAFKSMVETLPWITPASLNAAKNKSQHIQLNIGWPTWFNFDDATKVDNYHIQYESILDMSDWWLILRQLHYAYSMTESYGLIDKEPDRANFLQSPSVVNAWYMPSHNSITFPYGILNPPYYRLDFPQAFNYAGQGGTAGHEFTHGYDDQGVQYGPYGELADCVWDHCGWMDSKSILGFNNMAQCVISQFSQECCPLKTGNVHCANGVTTQGENIADIGGERAAFLAYRNYVEKELKGKEEDRLPGMEEFTPNQIFWIAYGFSWCRKMTDARLARQLLLDPHSPSMCRVNEVVKDIPEFGEAFMCSQGDKMYPPSDQRCHVWSK